MRSEPVTPVQARGTSEARREGDGGAPADAATDAFEASLQRARRGRRGPGDEAEARDTFADTVPMPLQAVLPTVQGAPLPHDEPLPARWAPRPVLAPDAATRQLQLQALPDGPGEAGGAGHWQLQITEAGLPVQRLDLQRSAAGPLTVLVSAATDAQQAQHTTRLRQRLARSGARVAVRGLTPEQEP